MQTLSSNKVKEFKIWKKLEVILVALYNEQMNTLEEGAKGMASR